MLKDVINEFKDSIEFKEQENNDVENYFYNELKCANVPNGVLEFYKEYDGCSLSINDIFSLEGIKNELTEFFEDFLKGMDIDSSEYKKYMKKAKDEYRKYQEITLSPVEEEYLKSIKGVEKEVKKQTRKRKA